MASRSRSLSIVVPVYNGSRTIARLVDRLSEVLSSESLEIVLVNDCSADDSRDVCRDLHERNPELVTFVDLAKNFGEHNAVMAGLHYATGAHVVIMDDDFQNPPEEVLNLVSEARRGGYDVVYSRYAAKQHSLARNLGSRFHNWLATFLLKKPRELYLSSFKCINRFTVREISSYSGPFPYIDGLILRCTSRIGTVEVKHDARQLGSSGYTVTKLVRLWLNMFLNFSVMPLRLSSLVGLGMVVAGAALGVVVVLEKWLHPTIAIGWPSLVVIVVTFGGVQLVMLGLAGEYLGHLFLLANQTPQFVVHEAHRRFDDGD